MANRARKNSKIGELDKETYISYTIKKLLRLGSAEVAFNLFF